MTKAKSLLISLIILALIFIGGAISAQDTILEPANDSPGEELIITAQETAEASPETMEAVNLDEDVQAR